jgi:hypothetical protein
MSFLVGFVEGMKDLSAERERKEARQQEIDLRQKEREEDKAFQRETFQTQLLESRRDNLYQLILKREQDKQEATKLTATAQSFLDRIGQTDDPKVAVIAANPTLAAQLEAEVRKIEIARAESDLDLPPLSGQALLDLITVQDPKTGEVSPVEIDLETIESLDMSDRTQYERMLLDLSRPQKVADGRISPEAYRRIKPEVLEEGRKVFDQEVLRLANQALTAAKDDANLHPKLSKMIEEYKTEGSAGRMAIRDMFGASAMEVLQAIDSPYIQNMKDDPQLQRYTVIAELNRIATDPMASEEERQRAKDILDRVQGGS